MIKKILVLLFLGCTTGSFADDMSGDRKDLQELVEVRREKFDSYSHSLERRSGIFGNKTKKDMLRSNEVLMEIVETDNRIIGLLKRVVDFKTYEKVNRTYDWLQNDNQLENLRHATDTLTKQVDTLAIVNATQRTKIKKLQWLSVSLVVLWGWSVYSARRKKTQDAS